MAAPTLDSPQPPDAAPLRVARVLRLQTDSHPDRLAQARRQVRQALEQAGLSPQTAVDMEVAAGELLSNIHEHAYDTGVGPVFVEVFRTPRIVGVIVIDIGRATKPAPVPRTLPPATEHGGRGLYLAGYLADEVKVQVNTIGHGLAVLMVKWLARRPKRTAAAA